MEPLLLVVPITSAQCYLTKVQLRRLPEVGAHSGGVDRRVDLAGLMTDPG
jgi:hypothetical protein